MHIFTTTAECSAFLHDYSTGKKPVGFVPTMGALHDGHLALINRSREENSFTACSIFVNPIQFDNPDDLLRYPRNTAEDTRKLQDAGCDLLFLPTVEEMYPEPDLRVYDFGQLAKVQEGAHRKGHFNGVAVVVRRLLEIINPDKAYFGRKDYQQYLIVRELVRMLGLPVEILACPVVREPDGLAMSSRNVRLGPIERKSAPVIFQTLLWAKNNIMKYSLKEIKTRAIEQIEDQKGLKVEYFEIANADDLQTLDNIKDATSVIATVAVFAGEIRLIDNMILI